MGRKLAIGGGTFFILAVVYMIIFAWWRDTSSRSWQTISESIWGRGLWPGGFNILGASPNAILLVSLIFGGVAFLFWPQSTVKVVSHDPYGYPNRERINRGDRGTARKMAALAAFMLISSILVWFASVNDVAEVYSSDTRFVVADTDNLNTNLRRLDGQYIEEGTFSQSWEPRVASATGAKTVMSRTSASDSGNQLLLDTMTYTYGDTPGWTAIRDGKKKQPLFGVAFWSGSGDVTTCRFTGQYSINKALHGTFGNSLLDDIAAYDKSLFFDEQDMWGYCDGDKPVIVIPVKSWDGSGNRAVWFSAGVLVITGSPSGDAQIERITNVEPGQFPGPVYPVSLAAEQRAETSMMAGRVNKWWYDFGYETTDVTAQDGNSSEFLLKSEKDERLYWVTPLTARSSDSQLITAYSLVLADEATSGTFNAMRIYVLMEGDSRIVNLEDFDARIRQVLSREDAGFFSSGGSLVEYLPLDDENWQVYAEINGRVAYRITVPTDTGVQPQVTRLDGIAEVSDGASSGSTTQDDSASTCAADPSALSVDELVACAATLAEDLTAIAEELKARQEEP